MTTWFHSTIIATSLAACAAVGLASASLYAGVGDGSATITVRCPGDQVARTTVTVTHFAQDVPVNFPNEVVPVFTKFTCNRGGCHGKASGQNGFKLS